MRNSIHISALGAVLLAACVCAAQEPEKDPRIGIEEHLGKQIDLAAFSFTDEDGRAIQLQDLFDRPIALTLVYYRCPGICTPLLQEVARVAGLCDLAIGDDYRVVTISFDPAETPALARTKKANMIAEVKNKQVSDDAWRFLTGDADNIRRITEAVGFHYSLDKNKTDFVHAATVIFLSPEGKIVRYLTATKFNPADLKMAVVDASTGHARSFMRRIERLCYSYDPEGNVYVLKVNRIILGLTLLFATAFAGFLAFKGTRGKATKDQTTESAS